MDVIERIKKQLEDHPVILFMKGTADFPQCGFSARVVEILNDCDAQFDTVNVLEDPELREALKTFSQWPTYPQLFVKGELIGGCDIVTELHANGELVKLLAST